MLLCTARIHRKKVGISCLSAADRKLALESLKCLSRKLLDLAVLFLLTRGAVTDFTTRVLWEFKSGVATFVYNPADGHLETAQPPPMLMLEK